MFFSRRRQFSQSSRPANAKIQMSGGSLPPSECTESGAIPGQALSCQVLDLLISPKSGALKVLSPPKRLFNARSDADGRYSDLAGRVFSEIALQLKTFFAPSTGQLKLTSSRWGNVVVTAKAGGKTTTAPNLWKANERP